MVTKSAKVLCGFALAEFVVFVVAAGRFGVLSLMAVVAVLSAVGFVLVASQARSMVRTTVDEVTSSSTAAQVGDQSIERVGDQGLRLLGALLLAFPGLLTGAIGALLFVDPVRSALRPLVAGRLARFVPTDPSASLGGLAGAFRRRDVVDVTYRAKGSPRDTASTGTRPELH